MAADQPAREPWPPITVYRCPDCGGVGLSPLTLHMGRDCAAVREWHGDPGAPVVLEAQTYVAAAPD